MEWDEEQPISAIGLGIESALEALDRLLMEDAFAELIEKGVV
jgi:hypothetical protein